jgi:hypothetical protein
MINRFLKMLKNKVFLGSLLTANIIVFAAGIYLDNIDLLLASAISYVTLLLSMELNKNEKEK